MSESAGGNVLTYSIEEREAALIVSLNGAADLEHSRTLEQCAVKAMAYRKPVIVLDLTSLTFVSSIGIGSLLSMRRAAQRNGEKFRVVGVKGALAELFATSGLTSLFSGYDTVEAALAEPV